MIHTDEQIAILDAARTTNDSLIVEALAGAGKTFCLIEMLKVMRQPSSLVLAFNKRIADEMTRRLPSMPRGRIVHVKTLHAAGLWILKHHYPKLQVDTGSTEALIIAASDGVALRIRGAAHKLLRLVKDFQHERELDLDYAFHLGADFGVFDKLANGHEMQTAVEITERAYRASMDLDKRDGIDYSDMGWLPLVLDLAPPSRYKAILLDEAQDVSQSQLALVDRLLASGGRVIACGDLNQQIYEWRGAVGEDAWDHLRERYQARSFPLTITWRCDKEIVNEANKIVPDLKARPDAGPGEVHTVDEDEFLADGFREVDYEDSSVFVLSRTNAELLRTALELWRRSVPFNIAQSTEILKPLKTVLSRVLKANAMTIEAFQQGLAAWRVSEMIKAHAAGSASWADRIEDQYKMLHYVSNYVASPNLIEDMLDNIYALEDTCWITLSTVHKAKGLEASTVFLLRETFQQFQNRRDRDGNPIPVPPEEQNVLYVAVTRARKTLVWVNLKRGS